MDNRRDKLLERVRAAKLLDYGDETMNRCIQALLRDVELWLMESVDAVELDQRLALVQRRFEIFNTAKADAVRGVRAALARRSWHGGGRDLLADRRDNGCVCDGAAECVKSER